MCQPAIQRFKWELEVSITRLQSLGVNDIVLLFSRHDVKMPTFFRDKYGVEVHVFADDRVDKSYIPSIKPYLWMRYLEQDRTRQNESYFYLDSDVLLRDIPLVTATEDLWYGSDCTSYLGVDYIDSKGEGLLESMCHLMGVNPVTVRREQPVAGAQWVIKHPTVEYWRKVYQDSTKLYKYLDGLKDNDIQKWTAEMWAQSWNLYNFGIRPLVSNELDFCWPMDSVDRYDEVKLFHNAGVVDDHQKLFFKGKYTSRDPFDDDLSFVDPSKVGIRYVDAIKAVNR